MGFNNSPGFAGGNLSSPLSTKGDIWVYGTGNTRLPVGVDGQTLMADSAEDSGLAWGVPAGGSGATENGTSVRLGSGTSFANNARVTVYGVNAGSSVGQDNFFGGYNVKGGTASGSFNTFLGSRINELANDITGGILIGRQIQPYVSSAVYIGSSPNDVRYTGAVIIGPSHTLPTSSTWTGANGVSVIIGSTINDSNTTPTQKRNILIGYNMNLSSHTNTTAAVLISHAPTLAADIQNSVGIGNNVSLIDGAANSVVIGPAAKYYVAPSTGSSGGQAVAVGYTAFAGSWRATVVGAFAQGLAVSTTVYGFGAYANAAHASAWGRGSYNSVGGATVLYNGATGTDYYFGGIGSAWTNPTISETVDVSADLDAGTIITRITTWSGKDYKPVPTLTNVRGAHLRVMGGVSSGTALGGEVQIATSPAGASSNNLNSEVVCASFDAVATGGAEETRFMLLDLTTGTLKRVSFGANDSGGTGFKYLRVVN
jgi:hypothetical protein